MYNLRAALMLTLLLAPAMAMAQHVDHATGVEHASAAAHHDHDDHAAIMHVPADHVRWMPDASLIQGMARVRTAVATLAHHEMGHMGDLHVLTLADEIDSAVAFMFANCKLDPRPDVALHGLLARLMAGTQALHATPGDASPVADMRAAVQDYAKWFDDPGIAADARSELEER